MLSRWCELLWRSAIPVVDGGRCWPAVALGRRCCLNGSRLLTSAAGCVAITSDARSGTGSLVTVARSSAAAAATLFPTGRGAALGGPITRSTQRPRAGIASVLRLTWIAVARWVRVPRAIQRAGRADLWAHRALEGAEAARGVQGAVAGYPGAYPRHLLLLARLVLNAAWLVRPRAVLLHVESLRGGVIEREIKFYKLNTKYVLGDIAEKMQNSRLTDLWLKMR